MTRSTAATLGVAILTTTFGLWQRAADADPQQPADCPPHTPYCRTLDRCEYPSLCPRRRAPGRRPTPPVVDPPRVLEPTCPDTMALLPAGEFRMGSAPGVGDPDEHPQRTVRLDAFCLARTEVTQARYDAFVRATGHRTPDCEWDPEGAGASRPVVCVSWADADAYCAWDDAHGRLPTEAEWERAAAGGLERPRTYPWGDAPPSCDRLAFLGAADARCGGAEEAQPVATHRRGDTPDGVSDLAGNVWEWVADGYAPDAASRAAPSPSGPATGDLRVVRGGWFGSEGVGLRAADRYAQEPALRSPTLGFRCARDPVLR